MLAAGRLEEVVVADRMAAVVKDILETVDMRKQA